ncbi:MAG: hypothetical protein J7K54_03515 [Candidatus Aenigmarchaeota archaeon]|nr:hypothetical protein [Candidatus Aenigmarchaeota archaeon]
MKSLNLAAFVAMMGTAALALATKLFFDNLLALGFAYALESGILALFAYYFTVFLARLAHWKDFSETLKNPQVANLYSAMPIAAALSVMMLIKIGIPLFPYNESLAFVFWSISAVFSLFFLVTVPINLKFRVEVRHIMGTWFIPPVGVFVLISAGAVLASAMPWMKTFMAFFNLFALGPAFVLYFLTLSLLYFRTKFEKMPEQNLAPTFNIVLAPVGVSIMAVLFTANLLDGFYGLGPAFSAAARIYSLTFFGYGLWIIFGLILLYKRFVTEMGKIPFSEMWWAFVFPVGAFTLATYNIYTVFGFWLFRAAYLMLYAALLGLWGVTAIKMLKKMISV